MLLLSVNSHLLSLPPPNLKKNERKSILSMRIFAVPFTPFHTFPSFPAASSHSLFPSLLFCLLLFVISHSCTFSVSPPLFHYNPAVTWSHVTPAIYNLWGHLWRLKRQNKKQLVVKHFTLVSCLSSCNRNILHIDKTLNFICFSILLIFFLPLNLMLLKSTVIQDVPHSHSSHFPLMSHTKVIDRMLIMFQVAI